MSAVSGYVFRPCQPWFRRVGGKEAARGPDEGCSSERKRPRRRENNRLENKALSEKHSEPSETAKTRNGGQPFFGNKHTNKKGPARTAKAAMPGIPKKQSCKSLYAVTSTVQPVSWPKPRRAGSPMRYIAGMELTL